MKTFKNITEWIKSNPSDEQMEKVMNLVNKGSIHQLRVEVSEKERLLRKYVSSANVLSKVKITLPKELSNKISELEDEIKEMREQLPIVKKRVKKEKTNGNHKE